MAAGPDPQHDRLVVGPDLLAHRRAERGDRDRAGVIRVILVRCPGGQQPDPGAELGLDIKHLLAGRHELLGQHMAEPARALNRPGPLGPFRGPFQQLAGLGRAGTDPQLAERHLGRVDRHCGVGSLVRIHPDHH